METQFRSSFFAQRHEEVLWGVGLVFPMLVVLWLISPLAEWTRSFLVPLSSWAVGFVALFAFAFAAATYAMLLIFLRSGWRALPKRLTPRLCAGCLAWGPFTILLAIAVEEVNTLREYLLALVGLWVLTVAFHFVVATVAIIGVLGEIFVEVLLMAPFWHRCRS